jgi:outer membrane immunogenic protein
MKKFLIAAAGLVALTAPALAADMAPAPQAYTKAPPPIIAAVYNWTGFYIGGNVGYGEARAGFIDEVVPEVILPFGSTVRRGNIVGGGQVGYNWQFQNIVFGVEGNYTGSRFNQTATVLDSSGLFRTMNYSMRDTWDISARVGFASNNWLFYGKGGYAGSGISLNVVRTNDGSLMSSASTNLDGFVAGAGIEYGITRNWIVGVEYDYYGFSKRDLLNVATFNGFIPQNYRNVDLSEQTVTARISYKFGGPVVARY